MSARRPFTSSQRPLELVLSRLEEARPLSRGFIARCPAHDDHAPSLSIGAGDDGRILLHCWAGCETAVVLESLGLTWRDLFPRPSHSQRRR